MELRTKASRSDAVTEREREIITLRFGLDGREERTQKEVADHLGISQSYISRLEKRIMQRLKKEILRESKIHERIFCFSSTQGARYPSRCWYEGYQSYLRKRSQSLSYLSS